MTNAALGESAPKAKPTWWMIVVGLVFVAAAIERAMTGGSWPSRAPTILYALTGVLFIVQGLRAGFRKRSKSPSAL